MNPKHSGQEYFQSLVETLGPVSQAQGFTHPISQQSQFKSFARYLRFLDIKPGDAFSLLDIGGGIGELYTYLIERGFTPVMYGCVDTNEPMLREAEKRTPFLERGDFVTTVDQVKFRYDVAVSLNMWTYWIGGTLALYEAVSEVWEQAAGLSRKGVAMNFVSPYADWLESYNTPIPVEYAVDLAKKSSERVMVDMMEAPHLYLVGVNKNKSEFRHQWKQQ